MFTQTVTVKEKDTQNIIIGRRGTYGTEEIVFDLSWLVDVYGNGSAVLMVKRPVDETAYPAVTARDGNNLIWTVGDVDTSYKGHGECELFWYVDESLAKSVIYSIAILRDIGETEEAPPDPYQTWIDDLTELGAETLENARQAAQSAADAAQSAVDAETAQGKAETAQEKAETAQGKAETAQGKAEDAQEAAEAAVEHYPKIVNSYWYVWQNGEWVNTGVKAEGSDGREIVSVTCEKTGTSGLVDTYTMTITYNSGNPDTVQFLVTNGEDGYNPVVTITTITGGHRVTITDKTHPDGQSFDVTDGINGVSPEVTITEITGGHRVTITDADHPLGQSFDVMDGTNTDAEHVTYDDTASYSDGTVGDALSQLNSELNETVGPYMSTTEDIPTPTAASNLAINGNTGEVVSLVGWKISYFPISAGQTVDVTVAFSANTVSVFSFASVVPASEVSSSVIKFVSTATSSYSATYTASENGYILISSTNITVTVSGTIGRIVESLESVINGIDSRVDVMELYDGINPFVETYAHYAEDHTVQKTTAFGSGNLPSGANRWATPGLCVTNDGYILAAADARMDTGADSDEQIVYMYRYNADLTEATITENIPNLTAVSGYALNGNTGDTVALSGWKIDYFPIKAGQTVNATVTFSANSTSVFSFSTVIPAANETSDVIYWQSTAGASYSTSYTATEDGYIWISSTNITVTASGTLESGSETILFKETDQAYTNISFVIDRSGAHGVTGRIFAFALKFAAGTFCYEQPTSTIDCVYKYSDDEGVTWSAETSIKTAWDTESYIGAGTSPANGAQLSDGTLIVPAMFIASYKNWKSGVIYLEVGGSWTFSSMTPENFDNECAVYESSDGKIYLSCRTAETTDHLYNYDITNDKWSLQTINYDNHVAIQRSIIAKRYGTVYPFGTPYLLLRTCPDPSSENNRNFFTLWLSKDGLKWIRLYQFYVGNNGGYAVIDSYDDITAIIYMGDGGVAIQNVSTLVENTGLISNTLNVIDGTFAFRTQLMLQRMLGGASIVPIS